MTTTRIGYMRLTADSVAAIFREITGPELRGPRGTASLMAATAVVLAVIVATLVRLPDPWWAGISAFISLQATSPASLRRGLLRVLGTASGAALALLLMPVVAYDDLTLSLSLWAMASLGILGFMVSSHGYAWLFCGITFVLVVLLSMDDPMTTPDNAFNRTLEVAIGSAVAVGLSWIAAPEPHMDAAQPAAATPILPGWTDLLGARFGAVRHAARAGFAVMLMPLLWHWLALPSLAQMPISVAAVMAVPLPTLDGDPAGQHSVFVTRALHRILGCMLGGGLGLLAVACSGGNLLLWLGLLAAGTWLAAHVQASRRGVGYVGTQAAVAFILTLVQGAGPPTSLLPGVDRFFGVTGGLGVLLGLSLLLDALFAPARNAATPGFGAQGGA